MIQKQQNRDITEISESVDSMPENKKRWGNHNAEIVSVRLSDENNETRRVFRTGSDIIISFDYTVSRKVDDAVFGIGIFNRNGIQCYGTNTRIDNVEEFCLEKSNSVSITLKNVNLLPGEYLLDLAIESENGIPIDYCREICVFEMVSTISDVGVCRIEHQWDINK